MLDHSRALVWGSFITVKVVEKASDTDIGRGGGEAERPLTRLWQGELYTF